ncbi:MAG: hypothetical protein H0W08_23395 [Acidobacteria bacterium]|nr:hypothetical protein [Acidobacteriota bacterium]
MKTSWAVILCKFTDGDDEPFSKTYYQDLFTPSESGSNWDMIRYFRDYSHGSLDLTESRVFGWYSLDKSVADYNALGQSARDHLVNWARAAAAANGVDLTPFHSTVVCTNRWHDIGASPSLSGVIAQGPNTPIPRLLSHEMCHVYGLQHSRIHGSDIDYMDPWDTMSAASVYSATDGQFMLIGPGLNAANMRSRDWLDESRVWKPDGASNLDETFTLRTLVRRDLPGFLAAEMPGPYLVEFRVREGWDGAIPRAAVLIHRFEGGHSYLMPGNLGSSDLIAGDSFGDAEPDPPVVNIFTGFQRLDVLSIDATANEATLRFRRRHAHEIPQAIDPMAVILSGRAYLIWLELHHPHEPNVAEVRAVLRKMSSEERRSTLERAKAFTAYGRVFEEAAAEQR